MRMLAFDEIDSTMLEADRQAAAGSETPLLIWAKSQTGGEGRHGRRWASPPGNLYWTMLLRRGSAWPKDAGLTFAAGLAVADGLERVGADRGRIRLKWPNDCLLDGRKIAGVLIRADHFAGGGGHVAVGIGVNLVSAPPDAFFPASSLAAAGLGDVGVSEMRDQLTEAFLSRLAEWERTGLPGMREELEARLHGVGEGVRVALDRDRTLIEEGVSLGLDRHGGLRLRRADGSETAIAAGDVLHRS
jgi:BirA family biotin operon repressor/biotin-[acetyl-CoA-carboxylase] ligase